MKLHHIAFAFWEIAPAVMWYTDSLSATVTYRDETWALVDVENTSIALSCHHSTRHTWRSSHPRC